MPGCCSLLGWVIVIVGVLSGEAMAWRSGWIVCVWRCRADSAFDRGERFELGGQVDMDHADWSEEAEDHGPFSGRPWLSSYAPGVEPDLEVPAESLPEMLIRSALRHRDRVALDFFGAETTYTELAEAVSRAAEALRTVGVKAGDRVALVLPNCPQHVVAFYAALRVGAVVVEHNPLYTAPELEHQLSDCGATFVVCWDKTAPVVDELRAKTAVQVILAVDLTSAVPWSMRLKLRLPIAKARTARAALTGPVPAGV